MLRRILSLISGKKQTEQLMSEEQIECKLPPTGARELSEQEWMRQFNVGSRYYGRDCHTEHEIKKLIIQAAQRYNRTNQHNQPY